MATKHPMQTRKRKREAEQLRSQAAQRQAQEYADDEPPRVPQAVRAEAAVVLNEEGPEEDEGAQAPPPPAVLPLEDEPPKREVFNAMVERISVTVVDVTYRRGHCVCVAGRGGDRGRHWYGKILDIREDTAFGAHWVLLHWFYTIQDWEDPEYAMRRKDELTLDKSGMMGPCELIQVEDYLDIVDPETLDGIVEIEPFPNDITRQEVIPYDPDSDEVVLFYRYAYSKKKQAWIPEWRPADWRIQCTCLKAYAPECLEDEQRQHYCPSCKRWFHRACRVKLKLNQTKGVGPLERVSVVDLEDKYRDNLPSSVKRRKLDSGVSIPVDPDLETLASLPITRGGTDGDIVGSEARIRYEARVIVQEAKLGLAQAEDVTAAGWKRKILGDPHALLPPLTQDDVIRRNKDGSEATVVLRCVKGHFI